MREAIAKQKCTAQSTAADTGTRVAWYVVENLGGLAEESALRVLAEVLRRRRAMYAGRAGIEKEAIDRVYISSSSSSSSSSPARLFV